MQTRHGSTSNPRNHGAPGRGNAGAVQVLFLTCHLPFPPLSGGRRREFELLTRLSDRCSLHVVAYSKTLDEDVQNAGVLRRQGIAVTLLPALDRTPRMDEPHPGVAHQVLRHRSATGPAAIAVDGADVVHVEGFYLSQHAPCAPGRTLQVEQNVESLLWAQRLAVERDDGRRRWLRRERVLTRAAEAQAWHRADLVGAVTPEDCVEIERRIGRPVTLIPDGADHGALERANGGPPAAAPALPPRPRVVLVGNFAYAPNVDAAQQLVGEILPRMRALGHEPSVLLVGNDPPPEVRALTADPGVTVTGRVPAVEPYVDAADVVVCPLRIGGGVKVKVLEALARGRATVTTTVGAQGLAAASAGALRIADDPDAFAAEVAALLADPASRQALEAAAARAAPLHPSWDDAAEALYAAWSRLAARELARV
jgi:glycosyltransferase involved in cell wall biosynthesis